MRYTGMSHGRTSLNLLQAAIINTGLCNSTSKMTFRRFQQVCRKFLFPDLSILREITVAMVSTEFRPCAYVPVVVTRFNKPRFPCFRELLYLNVRFCCAIFRALSHSLLCVLRLFVLLPRYFTFHFPLF